MTGNPAPILRDIVLVGGGHSHVIVLRAFARRPLAGVRLTLISTDTDTPYSGMLPGYIAGHYSFDDMHIDLRRLATVAGARYYHDEVTGIDRAARKVLCRHRPPMPYDVLSVDIGGTSRLDAVNGARSRVVLVKPIRHLNQRWLALLDRVRSHAGTMTIAVVGAGASGVELTLAMQYRLSNELNGQGRDPDTVRFHLISAQSEILPTHNAAVRHTFERLLEERGITVHTGSEVTEVSAGRLETRSGEVLEADEILWVTGSRGAKWLQETGLSLDELGFIRVLDTLQAENDERIFAAGDCASMIHHRLEKAGVIAVRMGKPLAGNLRRFLQGRPLVEYRPQRRWLALISTGDCQAIASRGVLFARGRLMWRWKDWIDRSFIRGFNELPLMTDIKAESRASIRLEQEEKAEADAAVATEYSGCDSNIGQAHLPEVLDELRSIRRDEVLLGLDAPEDVSVVRIPAGKAVVQAFGTCRSFIDDPWLFGRIATRHALDSIYAMGGETCSASVSTTVTPGLAKKVEDTLFQTLRGVVEALSEDGCALVETRCGEGREPALGFAILGHLHADLEGAMRKNDMRPGDVLILTKPVGECALMAAQARLEAKGRWVDDALASMLVSSQSAATCLKEHGVTSCARPDASGLWGQLLAMTRASGVSVEIDLQRLPVLEGAVESVAALIERRRTRTTLAEAVEHHPNHALMLDPSISGGLLASVPAGSAGACLATLHALGYTRAAIIGRVLQHAGGSEWIRLKS